MGWLHRTGLWYVLATAYFAVAAALGSSASPGRLALRVLAAAATCANVWISDGYHNGDKRGGNAYTAAAETVWLRWDYVGISSVLTTQLWLWSVNFGWPGATALLGGVSGAARQHGGEAVSAQGIPGASGRTRTRSRASTAPSTSTRRRAACRRGGGSSGILFARGPREERG